MKPNRKKTLKKIYSALIPLLLAVAGNAFAGLAPPPPLVITTGSAAQTQVKGYAGLVWTLGGQKSALQPDAVVGVRSVKVKSDGNVNNGVDLSARFSFVNGVAFDSTRLSYVAGKRDLLANVGVGYSYVSKSYMATLAAQGDYSRVGVDYGFINGKWTPSLELLTLEKPKQVKQSTALSCPSPYTLVGSSCTYVPPL
jgi:hypothetical protein